MQTLSAKEVAALLEAEYESLTRNQRRTEFYSKFDQAAVFLLDWEVSNLFERVSSAPNQDWYFRCKGCSSIVPRSQLKNHHSNHKREYQNVKD